MTVNQSAQITDLLQCESYFVSVGIVGPIGPGPLSRSPKQLQTNYNNKKPPRNLKVSINDRHEMNITWENSCPFVLEETGYMVSVEFNSRHNLQTIIHWLFFHSLAPIDLRHRADTEQDVSGRTKGFAESIREPRIQ